MLASGFVADISQRLLTADALGPSSVHLSLQRNSILRCYKRFFFNIAHALKHVGTSQLSGLEWKLEQIIAAFIGALVMLHPECSC